MDLTDKQLRFCEEYVVDMNATQAAIRAGYSEKTANEQASRLLANVSVQEKISLLKKELSEKTGVNAQMVINELARIAFGDVRCMFSADNNLLDIRQLEDKEAATIASVEIFEEFSGRGENKTFIGYTKKVKMWDKVAALDKLGKYFGIYERDNNQKQTDIKILQIEPASAKDNG